MFYGIINKSNNCYLNVIIQMLISNKYTKNIINEYLVYEHNIISPNKLLDLLKNDINITRQNRFTRNVIINY